MIATFADYKAAVAQQRDLNAINIPTATALAGRPYDLWMNTVPLPTIPTTAVAPTNATAGSLGQENAGAGLIKSIIGARANANGAGTYIVVDRLSHQGGLSGTVVGAQTTNLPTAALTRYTSGEGVMIGLTIYTAIGTTATTVSVSYTNQAGTAGRVSPLTAIGATGWREVSRCVFIPLQTGDTGVRSVQSVSLTGTTGTAGAFGVVLFKPLYAILIDAAHGVMSSGGFFTGVCQGGIPQVVDNACLTYVFIGATANPQMNGAILFEDSPA